MSVAAKTSHTKSARPRGPAHSRAAPAPRTADDALTALSVATLQTAITQMTSLMHLLWDGFARDVAGAQRATYQRLVDLVFDAQSATNKATTYALTTLETPARKTPAPGKVIELFERAISLQEQANTGLIEAPKSPAFDNAEALQRARDRGASYRTGVIARGDMLGSDAVAERLGVSRQAVDKKRRAGELLALSWGSRRLHYPAWQLEPGILGEALKRVLAPLKGEDPWLIYRFFTTPEAALADATPLEALRAARVDEVVAAAQAYADRE